MRDEEETLMYRLTLRVAEAVSGCENDNTYETTGQYTRKLRGRSLNAHIIRLNPMYVRAASRGRYMFALRAAEAVSGSESGSTYETT